MKIFKKLSILLLILSFQLTLKGQSISIIPKLCDSLNQNQYIHYFHYSIKQNEVILQKSNFQTKPPYKIKGLKSGSYDLEYYNYYGQKSIRHFSITNEKTQNYYFCHDSILEIPSFSFLLDTLKISDTLKINVELQGCYHHIEEYLSLIKLNSSFKVVLREHNLLDKEIKDTIKEKNISIDIVNKIVSILEKNYATKDGSCTNTDYYIFYKNQDYVLGFADFGCHYSGFAKIKRMIGF
jgi:hypothetical protein